MDAPELVENFEESVLSEDIDFALGPGTDLTLRTLQMSRAGDGYWRPFGGFTAVY